MANIPDQHTLTFQSEIFTLEIKISSKWKMLQENGKTAMTFIISIPFASIPRVQLLRVPWRDILRHCTGCVFSTTTMTTATMAMAVWLGKKCSALSRGGLKVVAIRTCSDDDFEVSFFESFLSFWLAESTRSSLSFIRVWVWKGKLSQFLPFAICIWWKFEHQVVW